MNFSARVAILRALTALVLLAIPTTSTSAQSLKVLTVGAFKPVLLAVIPVFEANTGLKVDLQNDTAGALLKRLQSGEAFDVVVLTMPALNTLSSEALVEPASVAAVAKVGIGVAVKAGSPHPPLQTTEQFKDAVLQARKVAYVDPAAGGSSGIYLSGLFKRLGIDEAVRAKAVLVSGGLSAERVVSGEADLAIQQISELLPVAGASFVGPLPNEIQNYTTYGTATSPRSQLKKEAALLVNSLNASEAANVIRSKGMLSP